MNTETKEQIKNQLSQFVEQMGGQMPAARRMDGVSNATISNIVKGKFDNISDAMWNTIANQLKGKKDDRWIIDTDTERMRKMAKHYNDAKDHAIVFCLIGPAGTGKTAPAKEFSKLPGVFLVKCNEYLNRRTFLVELLTSMGKRNCFGYTVEELMGLVLGMLHRSSNPVIILDEADKLSDQVLYFFITIYNETEDKCGLIMQATDHLETRIYRGMKASKKGYKEIFSRIGRKFVHVPENTHRELVNIVKINGITDEARAIEIVNDSEGDIRRIKRLVFAEKRKMEEAGR